MQTALNQATYDRIDGMIVMQGKAPRVRMEAQPAHGPMHGLDHVAAHREREEVVTLLLPLFEAQNESDLPMLKASGLPTPHARC